MRGATPTRSRTVQGEFSVRRVAKRKLNPWRLAPVSAPFHCHQPHSKWAGSYPCRLLLRFQSTISQTKQCDFAKRNAFIKPGYTTPYYSNSFPLSFLLLCAETFLWSTWLVRRRLSAHRVVIGSHRWGDDGCVRWTVLFLAVSPCMVTHSIFLGNTRNE